MTRKKWSVLLKILTFVCAFAGTISACILAESRGHYHWATKLMYFTHQSNVWIAVTCLVLAVFMMRGHKAPDWLYRARYVFTVSITITCIIFCGLLAPFADYNVWEYYSILNHVVVPVLSIADFCIDTYDVPLTKKQTWLSYLPPLAYFAFAMPLVLCGVDFGKGEPYPYYFFNFHTEAGLFGFANTTPVQIGSVYWFVVIFLLIFVLARVFFAIHKKTRKYH
ncbi:MAG: hypothetical protein IJV77_04360 [Clostridia bacterium]|nr:hypothetical protein [Clostridia bacterium]